MSISKDQLKSFDPAIKKISVKNGYINLQLALNTSVLTISDQELHLLMKLLLETKA